MNYTIASPFESIESAYDFAKLLSSAVGETKQEIDEDIERESALSAPRRLDALRMASYNLEKLELHMSKSCRILNDLRSLRRLLFEERKLARSAVVRPKALPVEHPDLPITSTSATLSSPTVASERVAAA